MSSFEDYKVGLFNLFSRLSARSLRIYGIAVPLISAYSVINIPALVFDFRVAFTGSSSSGLDEWGSIIDACLAGDWPVCCLRSREPFTPLVARCGICLKRFRYEFANKPSLDSGLLKSDCFGTDGRTSLLLISSHFFSLTRASLFVRRRFGSRPFCYIVVAGPGGQSAFLNLALIHIGRISRKRPILITDFHRANQNFEDLDGIPADGHGCRNLRPCKVVLLRNVLLELRDRVY